MPVAVLTTDLGEVHIELDTERAPITAANFEAYIRQGLFDGATFYRAVDRTSEDGSLRKLVQGGLLDLDDAETSMAKALPSIEHEGPGDTGLKNVAGSVAMARLDPGTAQSEFFINLADAPQLDDLPDPEPPYDGLGYAVFGRVVEGMEILKTIVAGDTRATPDIPVLDGQILAEPVTIRSAEIW